MLSSSTTRNLNRELPLDELDGVAGGFPIAYEDGILAIGIPGVAGIFIGAGCIGGWLGDTGIAVCGKA
jgi:hypothetical protein